MITLIRAALQRERTVILLFAMLLISGMLSYLSIPKESEPDIVVPIIYTTLRLEGVAPEDAERLLVRPMEKTLASIEGIKEMTSHAYEGGASVMLEFYAGFNSDKALADVREKVDEARAELPAELDEEPKITEVNISLFPVVNVILHGNLSDRQLIATARELRDRIETLSGVLNAEIAGNREDMLEIEIDPALVQTYAISPQESFGLVTRNNVLIAAGRMDTGKGGYSLKVPGLLEDVQQFLNVPIKVRGDRVIRLRDIARVRRTFKDPTGFARVNGEPAVALEVSKRTGENLIDTVSAVRQVVADMQPYFPAGLKVTFSQDKSDQIRDMLHDLENNVILAILLVMTVVWLVMGGRSASLMTLTIPGAFFMGIVFLALAGFTMNIVVLFSLIMAIGMLVDAGIVVCEFADRKLHRGMSPHHAYGVAARRMAWPVISSTATTLMVFLPLLFWPGIVGGFMKYMPITLIVTLTGSLVMALIVLPVIGSVLGRWYQRRQNAAAMTLPTPEEPDDDGSGSDWDGSLHSLHPLTRRYALLLDKSLLRPGRTVLAVIALMAGIVVAYSMLGKGVEFFPDIEPENLSVLVHARGNLSMEERDEAVKAVEQRIRQVQEDLRVVYGNTGTFRNRDTAEDVIGIIQLELKHWQSRRKAHAIIKDLEWLTRDVAGVHVEVRQEQGGPSQGKPIQLNLRSRTPEALDAAATQVRNAMHAIGGFKDIEDSRPIPAIEWQLQVDREMAARYGLDIQQAGNFIKLISNGIIADRYRPDDADDEVDVIVRFPKDHRNLSELERLRVIGTEGQSVPLSSIITQTAAPTTSQIIRTDQVRVVQIKADVEAGLLPDTQAQKLQRYFQEHSDSWDNRVEIAFKGEQEDQQEASSFLATAFILALFGMYVIMLTQFNSHYQTAIVMSAVFFSTGGVFLGLLVTAQPFGIVMCGVAVISLAGIVVNNNIIFIDTYQHLLRSGMDVPTALMHTGVERLRPILLTAGTTVLGLVPMVIGMNIDFAGRSITFGAPSSQWWTQLSTGVAGGLTFATLLTLFFTPSLLLLGHRFSHRRRQKTSG